MNLYGKKYLVIGASSGIGRQVSIQLAQLGAQLVIVGRNETRLNETLNHLHGEGHQSLLCDVSDFDAAQDAVKQAVTGDGVKLDGCLFSAGIGLVRPISSVDSSITQKMFQTNFFSLVAILKIFSSRRISKDGASFVSLSSRAAIIPDKGMGLYSASKAAINAYTVVSAKELSKRGIRVNALCPEQVDTPMARSFKEAVSPSQLSRFYPLGMLTAEDVANTAVYLLSDYSAKITGQSIWMSAGNDGGCIDGYIL